MVQRRRIHKGRCWPKLFKHRGEGDAKASQIYADAFGKDPQFAQFWRSMEAYRNTFRDKRDIMVLEPNSDFFRYLRDATGKPAAKPAK